jgi:hypothetical protein
MNPSSREAGIPVLTEIIAAPPSSEERAPQPEIPTSESPLPDPDTIPGLQLERQLQENIFLELENHFELSLGARIQARILQKLQEAAVEIAEEVKQEILLELAEVRAARAQNPDDANFINR